MEWEGGNRHPFESVAIQPAVDAETKHESSLDARDNGISVLHRNHARSFVRWVPNLGNTGHG